ncbi:EFMT1 methyltransferase, partial [Atractosteus spatula]|nr:EFMT1 methyltransferase [Atractosteus spatula]
MSDSDDDPPRLSSQALAALQEFYQEEQRLASAPAGGLSVGAVQEDWRMSQFWYSEETAVRLAEELLSAVGGRGRIACVSAPSVYQKLKQQKGEEVSVVLLEFDRRFSIYGQDFVFYDYSNPLDLPEDMGAQSFDIVIADPPYLSEECLSKVALTVKFLTRGKVLLCTGAIMEEQAEKLLGVRMCKFLPKHNRSLANEFRCYVNYDSGLDL